MTGQRVDLKLNESACASIDAYVEYNRIVGDDDGGVLFTPQQYEAYKREVVPQRMKNRLYVSWFSPETGIECKLVGPETNCFCRHRYKQHKTEFKKLPSSREIKLPCRVAGCECNSFIYVPTNGSQLIRCRCKHVTEDHAVVEPYKCRKQGCNCCAFRSSFGCGCGFTVDDHQMLVETGAERETRGKPVGKPVPYKAMGGLTGFSSLADGYMRLDDSGIGAPSKDFLERETGLHSDPFLRICNELESLDVDYNNAVSKGMTKEEQDMAYFEKKYQERLKAKRDASSANHIKK